MYTIYALRATAGPVCPADATRPPLSASMYIIYFFPVNGICGRGNHKKDTLLS
jgi:hypothetical protein